MVIGLVASAQDATVIVGFLAAASAILGSWISTKKVTEKSTQELRRNGGSTLADAVYRIEAKVDKQFEVLLDHTERLTALEVQRDLTTSTHVVKSEGVPQ